MTTLELLIIPFRGLETDRAGRRSVGPALPVLDRLVLAFLSTERHGRTIHFTIVANEYLREFPRGFSLRL